MRDHSLRQGAIHEIFSKSCHTTSSEIEALRTKDKRSSVSSDESWCRLGYWDRENRPQKGVRVQAAWHSGRCGGLAVLGQRVAEMALSAGSPTVFAGKLGESSCMSGV